MDFESDRARLQCERIGQAMVMRLLDHRLTGHIAVQQLGEEMRRALDQYDSAAVVVNFGRVEMVSSAMIGKLIEFKNRVSQRGGRLVLTNVNSQISEVFRMTNIDRLFELTDEEADALAKL